MNLWIFCLSLVCLSIADAQEKVLSFGSYSNGINFGFATFDSSSDPQTFPPSPLYGDPQTCFPFGMAIIGQNLIFAGQIQFVNSMAVGGLLQYDTVTKTASPFTDVLFPSVDILGIAALPMLGDQLIVFGNFNSSINNPYYMLNNIALCNTQYCTSMGKADVISYTDGIESVAEYQGQLFIWHFVNQEFFRVSYWNEEQNIWVPIYTAVFTPESTFSGNLAVFDGKLYSTHPTIWEAQASLCSNITLYSNLMAWNGSCWSNVPYFGESSDTVGLVGSDQYGLLCASANSNTTDPSTVYVYCYNSSSTDPMYFAAVPYCLLFANNLIILNETSILLTCSSDIAISQLVSVTFTDSGAYKIQNWSTIQPCTSVRFECELNASSIWCHCTNEESIEIYQVDLEGNLLHQTKLLNVYTPLPLTYDICTWEDNILVIGQFYAAGNVSTPAGAAVWNGDLWTYLDVDSIIYEPNLPTAMCRSNGSELWVAISDVFNLHLLKLDQDGVLVEHDSLNDTQFYENGAFAVYGPYLVIINAFSTDILFYNTITGAVAWKILPPIFFNVAPNFLLVTQDVMWIATQAVSWTEPNDTVVNISGLIRLNLTSLDVLYTDYVDGLVNDMMAINNVVYIGGNFDRVGSITTNCVAACDLDGVCFDNLEGGIPGESALSMTYLPAEEAMFVIQDAGSVYMYSFTTNAWTEVSNMDVQVILPIYTKTPGHTSGRSVRRVIVIVIVSVSCCVLLLVALVYTIVKYRRRKPKYQSLQVITEYEDKDKDTVTKVLMDDPLITKIQEEDLVLGDIIGSGGQGCVYKAMLHNVPVAAKTFLLNNDTNVAKFAQEIKTLSIMKHRNILELKGIVITQDKIFLVSELMDSDLNKVKDRLTLQEKLRVAKEIASGMNFLHSQGLLHRDMKASNVLISKDGRCKIADFGLSRIRPEQTTKITQGVGTLTYMAPEVLIDGKYNEKADVYSFGILMCEIISGKHPFQNVPFELNYEFLNKYVARKIQPEVPTADQAPEEILQLIDRCLNWNSALRPSFQEIKQQLSKVLKSSQFKSLQ